MKPIHQLRGKVQQILETLPPTDEIEDAIALVDDGISALERAIENTRAAAAGEEDE